MYIQHSKSYAGAGGLPTRHFSDSILVDQLQQSRLERGSIDANSTSIFKRYSTGELGDYEAVSSSAQKKNVRFFGTVRVTLVARTEELLPFADLIWYNQHDFKGFKGNMT